MNITQVTNEQVKNDESARKVTDSTLAQHEEEAKEKKRQIKKRAVEIDVKQVIINHGNDHRIGAYEREANSGTVRGHLTETESPSLTPKKLKQRSSTNIRKSQLSKKSSTHTLDVKLEDRLGTNASQRARQMNADLPIDPMLRVQTKEMSTKRKKKISGLNGV